MALPDVTLAPHSDCYCERVKFGYTFANVGPFAEPESFVALAKTAEDVGFESIWAIEHTLVPVGYESQYPYHPSGKLPSDEDWPYPDPLLCLAYAAAATQRLKLATGVLILPQRHPAAVAKQLATLDQLSAGRAILGVGIGWLEEEFDAMGVPFRERVARTEEAIPAIRSLWQPGPSTFDGTFFRWGEVGASPKPVQAGGVPIHIGGHVDAAARRAARLGDGFVPGRGDADRMAEIVAIIRAECDRIGRNPAEVEITMPVMKPDLDQVKRYRDLGASRLLTFVPKGNAESILRALETLGDEVLAKL